MVRERLVGYIDALAVEVPQMAEAELLERACRCYNWRMGDRWDFIPATPESDQSFLDRIAVNYLRHQLTAYEDHLADIYGKVGTEAAYPKIKAKVLDAIAAAYPRLAAECERQK